jgi:rRNA small subunit pseudouridine methyltransferase Nep1
MTLIIFLVECGLEIVPKNLRTHPAVKKNVKKQNYASQLLDNAIHHSAMTNLPNFRKRGRPDILHACLLNILGAPANKAGYIKLYIHTIHNRIFEFNPKIKITRNYNRFKGLMAKLLIDGDVGVDGMSLITELDNHINELILSFQETNIILCTSKGKILSDYSELFKSKSHFKNYLVIIGGFQKGYFGSDFTKLNENSISVSHYSLDAWIVVSKIINLYENAFDIM